MLPILEHDFYLLNIYPIRKLWVQNFNHFKVKPWGHLFFELLNLWFLWHWYKNIFQADLKLFCVFHSSQQDTFWSSKQNNKISFFNPPPQILPWRFLLQSHYIDRVVGSIFPSDFLIFPQSFEIFVKHLNFIDWSYWRADSINLRYFSSWSLDVSSFE